MSPDENLQADGPAAGKGIPESLPGPVDERNPFWAKYREVVERVVGRAKEPFGISAGVDPSAETIRMVTRYAIRLVQQEHEDTNPRDRDSVAAVVYDATIKKFWGDAVIDGAPRGADVLDVALRYAVLYALSASGIEQRWREAAEWQDAWERTEAGKGATPPRARWLHRVTTIAIGIAIGAILGIAAAIAYYDLIAS